MAGESVVEAERGLCGAVGAGREDECEGKAGGREGEGGWEVGEGLFADRVSDAVGFV